MNKYIIGKWRSLGRRNISLLAFPDDCSKIDKTAHIYRFAKVLESSIGRYSYVGPNSVILNTEMGNFCSIACDVQVGIAPHTMDMISTSPIFTEPVNGTGHSWTDSDDKMVRSRRINIGSDVWIGFKAIIRDGVTIGHGAVVAAGAIVTHDVPPFAIVAGVPAKVIKYRFSQDIIDKILKSEWWNLPDEVLRKNVKSFATPVNEADIDALLDNIKSSAK